MTTRDAPPLLLVLAAGAWLALPLAAPYAASLGMSEAAWLYLAYTPVCHQNPERSFFLFGHQAAVCHRCLGLYAGLLLGLLLLPRLERLRRTLAAKPKMIVWFAVPMLLDVVLPFDSWASRFATGAIAGFPVALILWLAVEEVRRVRLRLPREGES